MTVKFICSYCNSISTLKARVHWQMNCFFFFLFSSLLLQNGKFMLNGKIVETWNYVLRNVKFVCNRLANVCICRLKCAVRWLVTFCLSLRKLTLFWVVAHFDILSSAVYSWNSAQLYQQAKNRFGFHLHNNFFLFSWTEVAVVLLLYCVVLFWMKKLHGKGGNDRPN